MKQFKSQKYMFDDILCIYILCATSYKHAMHLHWSAWEFWWWMHYYCRQYSSTIPRSFPLRRNLCFKLSSLLLHLFLVIAKIVCIYSVNAQVFEYSMLRAWINTANSLDIDRLFAFVLYTTSIFYTRKMLMYVMSIARWIPFLSHSHTLSASI